MTTIAYNDIQTPTTVEEFRENLVKYYVTIGDELLTVMGENEIPIKDISSFKDIYERTGTGFSGDGSSPSITPMVDVDMDALIHFMVKTGQFKSSEGFFESGDHTTIYTDQSEFINTKNVNWYTLDNQILREFYMKTLGSFSGYEYADSQE
jgi:hypothetical protein